MDVKEHHVSIHEKFLKFFPKEKNVFFSQFCHNVVRPLTSAKFWSLDVSLPGPVLPGVDVGALRKGARGASEGNHPVLSQVTNKSPLSL